MLSALEKGVIAAIAVTPIGTMGYMLAMQLSASDAREGDLPGALQAGVLVGLVGMLPAALYIGSWGLPAFLMLRSLSLANVYSCAAMALVPSLPVVYFSPMLALWLGGQSLLSAMAFWYFARHAVQPGGMR